MPDLTVLRTLALGLAVIASFVSVLLYCFAVLLSSNSVRELVVSAWASTAEAVQQVSPMFAIRLGKAMLLALFEGSNGFSLRKFAVLMLVLNSSAILGIFLGFEADLQVIAARELAGEIDRETAIAEHDGVIDATISLFFVGPLNMFSWSAFDFVAYIIAKRGFTRALQIGRASPVFWSILAILTMIYGLPLLLARSSLFDNILVTLFVIGSPVIPAMTALTQVHQCWSCSILALPAGLSATLSVLLIIAAIAVLSNRSLLRFLSTTLERIDLAGSTRLRNIALEIGTAAGVIIVVLTWRQIFSG